MCGGVAKPLVEGIREAGFDRSLTWQGTADGFRSARWESLRALPLSGKGRSLSGRLVERSELWRFRMFGVSAEQGGGERTIFRFRSAHKESLWTLTRQRQWPLSFLAFIQLRQQLWALQWRLCRH